jgi:DNA-binding MarR family transcriptional regulator
MAQVIRAEAELTERSLPLPRQQEAVVEILRTTNFLRNFCSPLFEAHGITAQQYNVLRILRGAGLGGLPTLEIIDRMVEQSPGVTRLLDRLEAKKLVRRERPPENRRQVLCYITKSGLDLLGKLDEPMKGQAVKSMRALKKADLEELIRLMRLIRNERQEGVR